MHALLPGSLSRSSSPLRHSTLIFPLSSPSHPAMQAPASPVRAHELLFQPKRPFPALLSPRCTCGTSCFSWRKRDPKEAKAEILPSATPTHAISGIWLPLNFTHRFSMQQRNHHEHTHTTAEMVFLNTIWLLEQTVRRQHCTYLPCCSFDELSEDQLPQITCHSPTDCCMLLGIGAFSPLPAHMIPWLIFLAQLAKEISSKRLAGSSTVSLPEPQAAALKSPFRANISQVTLLREMLMLLATSLSPLPTLGATLTT